MATSLLLAASAAPVAPGATPAATTVSPAAPAAPAQGAAQPEQAPAPEPPQAAPLTINEDIANVLELQAEVIVQRQMYHSQMMVGVSALGTDAVSARNAVLTVATALRNKNSENLEHALANLGDPQLAQINDHTLPWKFNAQVAGLMEGLLIDTLMQAYREDPQAARGSQTLEVCSSKPTSAPSGSTKPNWRSCRPVQVQTLASRNYGKKRGHNSGERRLLCPLLVEAELLRRVYIWPGDGRHIILGREVLVGHVRHRLGREGVYYAREARDVVETEVV